MGMFIPTNNKNIICINGVDRADFLSVVKQYSEIDYEIACMKYSFKSEKYFISFKKIKKNGQKRIRKTIKRRTDK